jgi:hypothetical protein
MNKRIRLRLALLGLLLVTIGLCQIPSSDYADFKFWVSLKYDATRQAIRYAILVHEIQDANRVVATFLTVPVQITLTGGDAQKIVRAVSSSKSVYAPTAEIALTYANRITFYKGQNVVGRIEENDGVFVIDFKRPPFGDPSGTLRTLIDGPLGKALHDACMTNSAAMEPK